MKKLIVFASALAIAAMTHAATCAWQTEWVVDADENDAIGTYWLVELTRDSVDGISVSSSGSIVDANGYISAYLENGVDFDDPGNVKGTLNNLTAADNGRLLALVVASDDFSAWGISQVQAISGISDSPPMPGNPILFYNHIDSAYGSYEMQVVPEPTSVALLALGLAALGLKRKVA